MLAMLGMYVQALVTGKGPVSNWLEHLADPSSANGFAFATKFAPTLLASTPADGSEILLRKPCGPPRARGETRTITEVPPHWREAFLGRSIRRSPPSPDVDVRMPGAPQEFAEPRMVRNALRSPPRSPTTSYVAESRRKARDDARADAFELP